MLLSKIRKFCNFGVCFILLATYIPAIFFDPIKFVGDLSPNDGTDPSLTWKNTPPTSRGLGPQLGAWALCWVTCMLCFMIFEPTERTHVLVSRQNAIIMFIVWPLTWYLGMVPNPDFAPMNAETYFWTMSVPETIMGVVFTVLAMAGEKKGKVE